MLLSSLGLTTSWCVRRLGRVIPPLLRQQQDNKAIGLGWGRHPYSPWPTRASSPVQDHPLMSHGICYNLLMELHGWSSVDCAGTSHSFSVSGSLRSG